jgi:hypothetical protein
MKDLIPIEKKRFRSYQKPTIRFKGKSIILNASCYKKYFSEFPFVEFFLSTTEKQALIINPLKAQSPNSFKIYNPRVKSPFGIISAREVTEMPTVATALIRLKESHFDIEEYKDGMLIVHFK